MTIRITRVYTRTGDRGTTALVGGTGIYPFDKLRAACACETCRRGGIR